MSNLVLATNAVNADDGCYSLKELNEPSIDLWGLHRYRIMLVVPGGRLQAGMLVVDKTYLREWRFDMGLADLWQEDQFALIGGVPRSDGTVEILETVGHMLEMAERIHAGYIAPVERPASSDLIGAFHDQYDQARKARRKVSTFGYGPALQRS